MGGILGRSVRIRRRKRSGRGGIRKLFGVKRRVTGERGAQILGEIGQIGDGENPVLEIREGDEAGGVDVRVGTFDDHLAGGIDINARRLARVGLDEPEHDGDMVGNLVIHHWYGAFDSEEIHCAAIVVRVGGGAWLQTREGFGKGKKMLADHPFNVLGVRQGRRTPSGEGGGQELERALGSRRGGTGHPKRRRGTNDVRWLWKKKGGVIYIYVDRCRVAGDT